MKVSPTAYRRNQQRNFSYSIMRRLTTRTSTTMMMKMMMLFTRPLQLNRNSFHCPKQCRLGNQQHHHIGTVHIILIFHISNKPLRTATIFSIEISSRQPIPSFITFPKDIFYDLNPLNNIQRYLNHSTLRPYTKRTRLDLTHVPELTTEYIIRTIAPTTRPPPMITTK